MSKDLLFITYKELNLFFIILLRTGNYFNKIIKIIFFSLYLLNNYFLIN